MRIIISAPDFRDGEADATRGLPDQPLFQSQHPSDVSNINLDLFKDQYYRDLVARRLSGAVQIPTVIADGIGEVGKDPRWGIFHSFTQYLRKTFPILHDRLSLEVINQHALLYTWQGSNPKLKPLLFMAHSDVVSAPESTLERWTYPPFSGHYDGEYIWGRGSEDDKSNLIAILSAIDALIHCDFTPTRTVLVSIGFDEEGGLDQSNGARYLAERILETYGEDGIELIFDEGIAGIEEHFGTEFALPATAEKGYLDVQITIDTTGGHSSTPPDHTCIGYLAQAINAIEASPFTSRLTNKNPTTVYLKIAALHSKNMPLSLRKAILDPSSSNEVLNYMDSSLERRALVRTSTAVDIMRGGEQFLANALPETAYAVVNHRIAVEDSIQVLKDYYIRILSPLTKKWGFSLIAFGNDINNSCDSVGTVTLAGHYELEPSPVSNHRDVRFTWLADTLQAVFGKDVCVAPVLLTGKFMFRPSEDPAAY
ncbi:Carboxypeptidase [Hyphodiscus hymeniophilus]|uniref:Carboxypeptidase n=1 Tax=Hyphodiscus hymeniophilus TaxID=353542 RepID=A0A9P7AW72_9HELO|nr:Carboxypeptidase [Hyphodiscus hymeniophilus]